MTADERQPTEENSDMGKRAKRVERLRAATARVTKALDRYGEAIEARKGRKRALARLEKAVDAFDDAHDVATGEESPLICVVEHPYTGPRPEPYEPGDTATRISIISRVDYVIPSERRLAEAVRGIDPEVTHLGQAVYALDHVGELDPDLVQPVAGVTGFFACDVPLGGPEAEIDLAASFTPPGELLFSSGDSWVG